MSMWNADDYRAAAQSATSATTRLALYEQAEQMELREANRPARIEISVTVDLPTRKAKP